MAKKMDKNPGMVLVASYGLMFPINALIIWGASELVPSAVVLGTGTIPMMWAIILSVGTLTLINTFAIPFIREIEIRKKRMLTPMEWMVKYFILNTVSVWLIARFSQYLGMGIASFWVAIALGVVLDMTQGVAMMQLEKWRKPIN